MRAGAIGGSHACGGVVDGDLTVIRWIFEFDWLAGGTTRMEELAYQRWQGERIVEEQFFYDPAQLVPRT